jgi:putative ABC transport system permease protein
LLTSGQPPLATNHETFLSSSNAAMLLQRLIRPISLGVQSLRLHKLRSLLTILGVVFGVASVIVMLAVGEGARTEAIQVIRELGATNIILRSARPVDIMSDTGTTGAIQYGLTKKTLEGIQAAIPSIVAVAPMRDHRREIRFVDRSIEGRVVGVTPTYQDLNDIELEQGRFIEPLDVARATSIAVLGAETAATLFPLTDPLGKSIRIGEDQYYQVVGVAKPRAASPGLGSALPAEDYTRDVYIPFDTDQKCFGENVVFDRASSQPPEKVEIRQLVLSVGRIEQIRPTARIVESLIQQAGKQDESTMTVPLDLLEKAEQTQRIFTWVLTTIASISLLVGGIGIMNIMLATVTERTREIGIRRALGARRVDIIWQFLVETTVLSCAGGLVGVGLGLYAAHSAQRITGVATLVQPWSPLLAFGVSLCVGLVFGIYPARRAAMMDPIQALRHD